MQLELAALRHQLAVYRAERRKPRISSSGRLLWSLVSKWWSGWRKASYIVQARTVVAWQKRRFRDYWRALSQHGRHVQRRIRSPGMKEVITAPASPWLNPFVERVIGSIRRELLDHVVVLNKQHLKRLPSAYLDDYHPWRTHRSLAGDAPDRRPVRSAKPAQVVDFPAVHGLHHYYLPKVA